MLRISRRELALEAELLAAKVPLSMAQLRARAALGTHSSDLYGLMNNIRCRYGERFEMIFQDCARKFRIWPEGVQSPRQKFINNLWRGWKHPVTGYQPERLGV